MALDAEHPLYSKYYRDWRMLRHVYDGERAVKEEGIIYLPPTAGMVLDGMAQTTDIGYQAYLAYKQRAVFHEFFSEGIEMLVGLLHQKPANIELPAQLEPLRERATVGNETLQMLLRRMNEQQLLTGRCGLLADLPATPMLGVNLPLFAMYNAESIINWDDTSKSYSTADITMVVLTEHGYERDENDFSWRERKQFRVLVLEGNVYKQGVFTEKTPFDRTSLAAPLVSGRTSPQIPFVFANTKDIVSDPDKAPLIGLANLALAVYRNEADYRQSLYMQSQDTLVIIGGIRNPDALPGEVDAVRTGAGSRIDVDVGGDAKYIGVSANGLPEMRMALENDKRAAAQRAGQMIQTKGPQAESGDALRTRLAAQTATLNQIADTSAGALEEILKKVAVWVGADPKKVRVEPNKEFVDFELAGDEFLKLMTGRTMGLPISKESLHMVMRERGLTRIDFEDEIEKIKKEDKDMPPPGPLGAAGGTAQRQNGKADEQQTPANGGRRAPMGQRE